MIFHEMVRKALCIGLNLNKVSANSSKADKHLSS